MIKTMRIKAINDKEAARQRNIRNASQKEGQTDSHYMYISVLLRNIKPKDLDL